MALIDRDIIGRIKPWLDKPEIIVLIGARQVGKTSLMKLLMRQMQAGEYLYLDLEDIYNLRLLSDVTTFLDNLKAKGLDKVRRPKVFIDEIQYLPDPARFLKVLHDHYPNIKLIVSGSSAFDMRRKFSEGLTGRKIVFEIPPLNFKEFLCFRASPYRAIKENVSFKKAIKDFAAVKPFHTQTPQMVKPFEEFVIFGGYPLPALTTKYDERIARLKEIHNTYIQKDIRDLAKIENLFEFNKLVSFLAVQISGLFNYHEVSKELGLNRRDLKKYTAILEKTYVVNWLKPFYKNRQKELTKMAKLFFLDTGLRNINISDMRSLDLRPDKGALVENACFQELLKQKEQLEELHFWRTKEKAEVDMILLKNREPLPIEVKYRRFTAEDIPFSLRVFIGKYAPEKAVVVTKDYFSRTRFGKTQVLFIPAWML